MSILMPRYKDSTLPSSWPVVSDMENSSSCPCPSSSPLARKNTDKAQCCKHRLEVLGIALPRCPVQEDNKHDLLLPEFLHPSVFITEKSLMVFNMVIWCFQHLSFWSAEGFRQMFELFYWFSTKDSLHTRLSPRTGKDIFLYFKSWAKDALNKGLRSMCEGDSFYIDTHTVHKTVDSSKQCNIFRGGKNYLAA